MKPNIAERAGRWSASHWKTATFGWLALVTVSVVVGHVVGTVPQTDAEQASGENARAQAMLAAGGFHDVASEAVLVQSPRLVVGDPRFRATLSRVLAAVSALPEVRNVTSPLDGTRGDVSRDGHSALVEFDMRGAASSADNRVAPVLAAVARVGRRSPGFTVAEFGDASSAYAINRTVNRDFSRAETLTVPVTFAVLLIAFGAFVAAAVPVALAFSAVLGSLGLFALASHLLHASSAASSVMLLMGMAVGVDYSLFYVKREREERRTASPHEALARAAGTSGRAVLISGATVLIAMAGMLFAGSKVFGSIGIGAMLVVFTTMIGSLTVLPALLGRLGDRVDRGVLAVLAAAALGALRPLGQPGGLVWLRDRRTLIQRAKRGSESSRLWQMVLRPALRFPLVAVVVTSAVLMFAAAPVLGIHTKLLSFSDLPKSVTIVRTYEQIERAFPGAQTPAVVVIEGRDLASARVHREIAALEREALATHRMSGPISVSVNAARTVAHVDIPLAGNGNDRASMSALATLEGRVLPATLGRDPGLAYAVTGQTAGTRDFNQTIKHHWPIVFAFVLGLAFVLLLLTFRSIVVPATAIVLNLLSVGAAYGVLVWIFQDGHLQGLLGFHSNGAVVTWLPLFLFAVLFGLSMDYHVFIVSRIKELVDRGVSTENAVARGIAGTAGTVTAAAAVMVAVFAVFASLATLDIKQMGVGLAVAVLIDATLIRGILLPATMKLLGRWNWYLPRWLGWMPRVRSERPDRRAVPELG